MNTILKTLQDEVVPVLNKVSHHEDVWRVAVMFHGFLTPALD
jgi:hypothetical protein